MSILRVEARQVSKTYEQAGVTIPVLKALDLSMAAGETVAILGQSGSGKSTLLSLLAGLDQPTSGTIHIDGQDITTLSEEALAKFRAQRLGIVFQQFHLMSNLTALENVSLPLEVAGDRSALSKAREALEQVGLTPRGTHFPSQLSGGERQRVAIARALIVRPALLLADEPSGNLDDATGRQVMQLLFDLVERQNTTLLLVTHNDELARRCHRRLVLKDGRLQTENPKSNVQSPKS